MRIYTRTGDGGETNLFYGGRVRKDHPRPVAYGTVDELQAALGVARAHTPPENELAALLIALERDLYVVMGELATLPENRSKLQPGVTLVTPEMVTRLENRIDAISTRFAAPTEFVLPGETTTAAFLDVSRVTARRAEREVLKVVDSDSYVLRYLNRLSDLLWVLARWEEGTSRLAKDQTDMEQR